MGVWVLSSSIVQIAELQADVDRLMNLQQLQDELDSDEFLSVLEESELYSLEVGGAVFTASGCGHWRWVGLS